MIFKDFWLLENLLTGKTSSHVLEKPSLLKYQDLRTCVYRKFEILLVKGQGNLQTQQLILIYTKVNNYFNSWTKFPLNKRKKSKALKFNRQLSKLPVPPIETIS